MPLLRSNVRAAVWQPNQRPKPILPTEYRDLNILANGLYYHLVQWEEHLNMAEESLEQVLRKRGVMEQAMYASDGCASLNSAPTSSKKVSHDQTLAWQTELHRMAGEEHARLSEKARYIRARDELEQLRATAEPSRLHPTRMTQLRACSRTSTQATQR